MERRIKVSCNWIIILAAVAVVPLVCLALVLSFKKVLILNLLLKWISGLSPDGVLSLSTHESIQAGLMSATSLLWTVSFALAFYLAIFRLLWLRLLDNFNGEHHFSQVEKISYREHALWILVALIAVFLVIPRMGRSLGYDELVTAVRFVAPVHVMPQDAAGTENHRIFTYAARAIRPLASKSDLALRFPALIFGLLALYAFWRYAYKYLRPKAAFFACILLAVSPPFIMWSSTARGYTSMMLLAILSSAVFFRLLKIPSIVNIVLYVGLNILGLLTHAFFVTILAVQWICLTIWSVKPSKKESISKQAFAAVWIGIPAAIAVWLISYGRSLPFFIYGLMAMKKNTIHVNFLREFITMLTGGFSVASIGLIFAFLTGLFVMWRDQRKHAQYIFILVIFPALVAWLLKPPFLFARFFVFCLPFFILSVSKVFDGIGPAANGRTQRFNQILILLAWLSVFLTFIVLDLNPRNTSGVRASVDWVKEQAKADDGFCALGNGAELFSRYDPNRIFVPYDFEDFRQWSTKYHVIYCVSFSDMNMLKRHELINDWLMYKAIPIKFGNCNVFLRVAKEREK